MLQPLTYDLDTSFHKLFGEKSRAGLKVKQRELKRQTLLDAGYSELKTDKIILYHTMN